MAAVPFGARIDTKVTPPTSSSAWSAPRSAEKASRIVGTVLLAILVNSRLRIKRSRLLYLLLFAALVVAFVLPPESLLIEPVWLRYVLAAAVAFAPLFMANLIFTFSFRDTKIADMAFASNLVGAMLGGVIEYAALITGYRALLIAVAILYALAWLFASRVRLLADVG